MGVVLYEVLSRRKLFEDPFDYVMKIKNDIRVELHDKVLENLLNSCLRRNPIERPSMKMLLKNGKHLMEYLHTAISRGLTLKEAVDVVTSYMEVGEFDKAMKGIEVLKIKYLTPSTLKVLDIYKNLWSLLKMISEYQQRNKPLPVDKLRVDGKILLNTLELLDNELEDKVVNDQYSLELYLNMHGSIPPEMFEAISLIDRIIGTTNSHILYLVLQGTSTSRK